MIEVETQHLRVLIANEKRERLELLARVVAGLGHDVIAHEIDSKEVGAATARERPDVALVGLGVSSEHALDLIREIVREASCPVIALLSAKDSPYIHEAAKLGVFAYIVDAGPEELQSAIEITIQRFAEYHNLQGTLGRRAVCARIECALECVAGVRRRPGPDRPTRIGERRRHSRQRRLPRLRTAWQQHDALAGCPHRSRCAGYHHARGDRIPPAQA